MRSVGRASLSTGVRSHALSKWCLMTWIMREASYLGMSLHQVQRRSDAKRGLIDWNSIRDALGEASCRPSARATCKLRGLCMSMLEGRCEKDHEVV